MSRNIPDDGGFGAGRCCWMACPAGSSERNRLILWWEPTAAPERFLNDWLDKAKSAKGKLATRSGSAICLGLEDATGMGSSLQQACLHSLEMHLGNLWLHRGRSAGRARGSRGALPNGCSFSSTSTPRNDSWRI